MMALNIMAKDRGHPTKPEEPFGKYSHTLKQGINSYYAIFILMKLAGIITLSWIRLLLPILAAFFIMMSVLALVLLFVLVMAIIFLICKDY